MKFCEYSLGHNILEFYSVLVLVRLTASKTNLDIWYNKLGKRIASRVTKRLKTNHLRKYQNNLKLRWRLLSFRKQALVIAVKKQAKVDIKLFLSYLVLLDFPIFFQIFCPGLL